MGLTIGSEADRETPSGLTGELDPLVIACDIGIKLIVVGVVPDLRVDICCGVALIICTFLSVVPFGIIVALVFCLGDLSTTILKLAIQSNKIDFTRLL